jgi:hypothetical protein
LGRLLPSFDAETIVGAIQRENLRCEDLLQGFL